MTVFDGWSKEPEQREMCSYRTQTGHKGDDYQAGWRQGGGMAIAALARASTLGDGPRPPAGEYLDAARRRASPTSRRTGSTYLDDGHENIIDDYCALLAATELYAAAGDDAPVDVTASSSDGVERLLGAPPRERTATCWLARRRRRALVVPRRRGGAAGGGAAALAERRRPTRAATRRGARRRSWSTRARARRDATQQPVRVPAALDAARRRRAAARSGSSRTRTSRATGGRARTPASRRWRRCALAVAERGRRRGRRRWRRRAATRSTGSSARNPFDVCMLQGHGRNNPPYHPGFHNAPGRRVQRHHLRLRRRGRHRLSPDAWAATRSTAGAGASSGCRTPPG